MDASNKKGSVSMKVTNFVPLAVIAGLLASIGGDAGAQEQATYSYATKGILEIKGPTEHWKLLVDESNLGGRELEITELTLSAGKEVGRHRHGALEIFYVLSGTFGHEVNGKLTMLTPGMVGIARPGDFVRHLVPKESDVKLLVIWAPGGEAKRLLNFSKGTPVAQ
jgi:quercetin dioxygenase-like cupin family protein